MSRIYLDEEHGVNPMLTRCFYCNEPMGVALLGKMKRKVREGLSEAVGRDIGTEAPREGAVMDREPCHKCKEWMEKGIILISVDEERSKGDLDNPYRTGGWTVITEDAVKRIIQTPELLEHVLKQRVAFVPDEAWDAIGLPRGKENAEQHTEG